MRFITPMLTIAFNHTVAVIANVPKELDSGEKRREGKQVLSLFTCIVMLVVSFKATSELLT